MTDEVKTDKSGAPPCGLYVRINHDPDMDQWTPLMGALSTGVKYRSGYTKNMHVIEISLEEGFSRDALEKAAAFVQFAEMSGFVSVIKGDAQVAKDLDADGVLCGDLESFAEARKLLEKDAIIGVACGEDEALAQEAIKTSADYITFGTPAASPDLKTLISLCAQQDVLCAAIGPITNDTAGAFVTAGASFIDCTSYVAKGHEKGPMQPVVNMLYEIGLAVDAGKVVN